MNNYYAAVPRIDALLANYDRHRQELAAALARQDFAPEGPNLAEVYQSPISGDKELRGLLEGWYRRFQAQMGSTHRLAA